MDASSLVASLGLALGLCVPSDLDLLCRQPLAGWTICVDPGHGGQSMDPKLRGVYTGGAWGGWTCQAEGDVNLRVGLKLKADLELLGARVVMTRTTGGRITNGSKSAELRTRVETAKQARANLLISVHHNWSPNPCVNYSSVLWCDQASLNLAQRITRELGRELDLSTAGPFRGGSFCVLARSAMPAVIVEASFLSCYDEDQRLAEPSYNCREAWAIARGTAIYSLTHKPTIDKIKAPGKAKVLKKTSGAKKHRRSRR